MRVSVWAAAPIDAEAAWVATGFRLNFVDMSASMDLFAGLSDPRVRLNFSAWRLACCAASGAACMRLAARLLPGRSPD